MLQDAINKVPEGQNTINVSQCALWKGSLSSQSDYVSDEITRSVMLVTTSM